jgi:hypothetical protein
MCRGDDVDVDNRGEIRPGQVEWLDLGPTEPADRPGQPLRRRRPWFLFAAAIAVAVILVAALNRDTKRTTATPSHVPPNLTSFTAFPSSVDASPSLSPSPSVTVTSLGHRLLDVPVDWELFTRGPESVVRIELARGRVTRTEVPELANGAGVSFVVGPDRAIALTSEDQSGYLVTDGHRVRDLPAGFGHGPALPGPDPKHIWVSTGGGSSSAMTLFGFDGRRAGPSIRVPAGIGTAAADGAGYVRFYATGGVYDARPEGVKRITTGALLASGPTRWLTEECDAEFRCATTVTDRATGTQRALAVSDGNYSFGGFTDGVIAPNGSVAALARDDGQEGRLKLQVLDLSNADVHDTSVLLNPDTAFNGGGMFAWTPDSRWLFIAADAGRLLVLDRNSMRVTELSGSLPFVSQVSFRSG